MGVGVERQGAWWWGGGGRGARGGRGGPVGVPKLVIIVPEDYIQRAPTGSLFGNKFEINSCTFNI